MKDETHVLGKFCKLLISDPLYLLKVRKTSKVAERVGLWVYNRLNQNSFWDFESSPCAFLRAKLGFIFFKFIEAEMSHCHPSEVLHFNYNGEISQKLDLVITFDWRVLLT